MLVRADPVTNTISLLSFPRDLIVPIYCRSGFVANDRINSAFARCGSVGSLNTVHHLTGLPISYLIKVDFHGFKEVVDQLGGVWMDVDQPLLQPQRRHVCHRFSRTSTFSLVIRSFQADRRSSSFRFRHTDSDLYRLARQQEFVRAFKEQVSKNFRCQHLAGDRFRRSRTNVEVAGHVTDSIVLSYAKFAATLPGGHFFQDKISNISGYAELQASSTSIQDAVTQFVNPDVTVAKVANATALGTKVKTKAPSPQQDDRDRVERQRRLRVRRRTRTSCSRSAATRWCGRRTISSRTRRRPTTSSSKIYFDPKQNGSKLAANGAAEAHAAGRYRAACRRARY